MSKFGRIIPLCTLVCLLLSGCLATAVDEADPVPVAAITAVATLTEPIRPTATATPPPATATPTAAPIVQATGIPSAPPTVVPTASPTAQPEPTQPASAEQAAAYKIIGWSANGNVIEGWQMGDGPNELIFVGGLHGGYEWNTILLAYEVLDYLNANPQLVPESVTLLIIPVANPDGQARIVGRFGRFFANEVSGETGPGRFNGNGVDLNRNWDCNWQPYSEWGSRTVSGGSAPFSEPETHYLNQLFLARQPKLVVFWHSKFPGIFPGYCNDVRLADTERFGQLYGVAAGYPYYEDGFTEYHITGDASDYLNRIGIPSFAVETEAYNNPETDRNLAGVLAILDQFR
jgi:hypothetical protein